MSNSLSLDILNVWHEFNKEMNARGYKLLVTDETTQADELEEYGRVMSPLGTRAIKDDKYHPLFKLYVHPQFGVSLFVMDRCGNSVITGRTICHIKLSVTDSEHVFKAIEYAEKYMVYGENNPVPPKLPNDTITI